MYMCIYIYIYIYTYILIYLYVYIYVYIHIYNIYVYIYIYKFALFFTFDHKLRTIFQAFDFRSKSTSMLTFQRLLNNVFRRKNICENVNSFCVNLLAS